MRVFEIGTNLKAVCDWKSTRTGFRHFCNLFYKGREVSTSTAHYLNRTWEKFEYESVIRDAILNTDLKRKNYYLKVVNDKWGY